jgi:hypothetical protein
MENINSDNVLSLCSHKKSVENKMKAELIESQADMLEALGYTILLKGPKTSMPLQVSIRTTHAPDFNHDNLEIVLPIDPSVSANHLATLMDLIIKQGMKFKPNKTYHDILPHPFRMMSAKISSVDDEFEGTEDVLRVILPDSNHKLDEEFMDGLFKVQWQDMSKSV